VKTFKVNEQGKEYTTNIYKEGDFFGYLPVFEDKPYPESAEVLEDSEIYQIPKTDFIELLNGNHTIAIRFIQLLSNNLIENEQRLIDLAYNSVRKRVAQTLVFLDEKYKDTCDESTSINISRDDLASIAGTSTESTVRVLSDFRIEGLIEITGKSIAILDVPRLALMRN
jgi:CRP-like cAMP-binding protein